MFSRTSSALVLAIGLAGCGANTTPEPEGAQIECAIGPGAEFEPVCVLEQVADTEFVIHHPAGSFRRFVVTANGIEVADGAAPIEKSSEEPEGYQEIGVTNDRYRLPVPPVSASDE